MNIEKEVIDAVNARLVVKVEKDDYQEKVDRSLRDYRKKVNIPGFRQGMVPINLLKKMYGKAILSEEVNKIVSESLFSYIKENELEILGEPLPSLEQEVITFEEEEFTFIFDIALAPEFKPSFTKRDKLVYYTITPDENMMENQIKSYTGRYGSYIQEEVVEEKDMLKGTLVEVDAKGKEVEGGIKVEAAVLTPAYIKVEEMKASFVGQKKGASVIFNPQKAFEGNEAELSSLLKIEKEAVADFKADVKISIDEITRYKEAELNQDLFDKAFGEGVVKSEEEFKEKIKQDLQETLAGDSQYKYSLDVRELILKKTAKLEFPVEFLKRWVLATNESLTEETLEEQFDKMLEDLRVHLMKDKIAKKEEVKVESADLETYAKKMAKSQFAQYGMLSVPEDILENYAKDILKNEESVKNIFEKVTEEKVFEVLKEKIAIEEKEISIEDFNKMFEK